jgi:hypothetical protein
VGIVPCMSALCLPRAVVTAGVFTFPSTPDMTDKDVSGLRASSDLISLDRTRLLAGGAKGASWFLSSPRARSQVP